VLRCYINNGQQPLLPLQLQQLLLLLLLPQQLQQEQPKHKRFFVLRSGVLKMHGGKLSVSKI